MKVVLNSIYCTQTSITMKYLIDIQNTNATIYVKKDSQSIYLNKKYLNKLYKYTINTFSNKY